MALVQTAAPATAVMTVAEAKTFLRVDHSDDDTLIESLIASSTRAAENHCQRAFITQTWNLYLDSFPHDGAPIRIALPPLQSVSSITYVDINGATQTWGASNYQVDAKRQPGMVVLAPNVAYPSTQFGVINAVTVTFLAGYGVAAALPADLLQALRWMVSDMYAHRENTVVGGVVNELPAGVKAALAPYQIIEFEDQREWVEARY